MKSFHLKVKSKKQKLDYRFRLLYHPAPFELKKIF